jgi:hypothetical protein
MRRLSVLLAAAGLVGGAPGWSLGEMTQTLQLCSVSTFATISAPGADPLFTSENVASQELLPFAEIVASELDDGANQASSHSGLAVQFTESRISTSGDFAGQAHLEGGEFAEAFGGSSYTIRFDVGETTTCSLAGSMEAAGNGRGTALFRITDGEILMYEQASDGGLVSFDRLLEITPGNYELQVSINGYGQALPGGGGSPASGRFDLFLDALAPAEAPLPNAATNRWIAYPNPARDQVVVSMQGTTPAGSGVTILDASGRVVRDLTAFDLGAAWDLRDSRGEEVPSGTYFARADAGSPIRITVLR